MLINNVRHKQGVLSFQRIEQNLRKSRWLTGLALSISFSVSVQAALIYPTHVWLEHEINVCWETITPETATTRNIIQGAVERTWQAHSNLRFTNWGLCSIDDEGIRLSFDPEEKKWSKAYPTNKLLGNDEKLISGETAKLIFSGNGQINETIPVHYEFRIKEYEENAVHEFGHILGFEHEHNRMDTSNQECRINLAQGSSIGIYIGAYDEHTVMSYCPESLLSDTNNEGKLTYLTETEKKALDIFYNEEKQCFVDNLSQRWRRLGAWFTFDEYYTYNYTPRVYIDDKYYRETFKSIVGGEVLIAADLRQDPQGSNTTKQFTGGPSLFPAVRGNGLHFNGVSSAFSMPNPTTTFIDNSFGLEGWVYTYRPDDVQTILSKQIDGLGYKLGISNGSLSLKLGDDKGNRVTLVDRTPLTSRAWVHFAVRVMRKNSYEIADPTDYVEFFINGKATSRHDISSLSGSLYSKGTHLIFGANYNPNEPAFDHQITEFFGGAIDELKIYNKWPPTAEEIYAIYSSYMRGSCRPQVAHVDLSSLAWSLDFNRRGPNGIQNAVVNHLTSNRYGSYLDPHGDVRGRPLIIEGAAYFSNEDEYLKVRSADFMEAGSSDFSISFWVQTKNQNGVIVSNLDLENSPDQPGFNVETQNGKLRFILASSNGSNEYLSWPFKNISDGHPHQVVISVDRDNPNGGHIYIDGVTLLQFDPTPHQSSISNNLEYHIGAGIGGSRPMLGAIDEIKFFRRALKLETAKAIYEAQSAGVVDINDQDTDSMNSSNRVQYRISNRYGAGQLQPMARLFENHWEADINAASSQNVSIIVNDEAIHQTYDIPSSGNYRIIYKETDGEVTVLPINEPNYNKSLQYNIPVQSILLF